MRKFVRAMCHPGAQSAIGSIMVLLLTITLVACGDDSGTSANDGYGGSETAMTSSSRHSGPDPESSSSKTVSSSSVKAASSSSVKTTSSSSVAPASSSSKKVESSSSQKVASSSSSVKTASSSSSAIPASSGNLPSSSSKKVESSSSEYVPFDHSKTLAAGWRIGGDDRYKQFTDPRNGRSYYYIKIIGKNTSKDKDSVTIMAENLNIGEMVLGKDDQNDDTKIERYCYNNDTTKCDEFGGLYQWAEMMQLPSRCNTESCSDLIQLNHQGICPDGWRLMTYEDFYIAWHAETNEYGIKGTRSAYEFGGNNYTGLSLTGAGMRTKGGGFDDLRSVVYWLYPEEHEYDIAAFVHAAYVASAENVAGTSRNQRSEKIVGNAVRCVKLE